MDKQITNTIKKREKHIYTYTKIYTHINRDIKFQTLTTRERHKLED